MSALEFIALINNFIIANKYIKLRFWKLQLYYSYSFKFFIFTYYWFIF